MKLYLALLRKDWLITKNYIPIALLIIIIFSALFINGPALLPLAIGYLWALYLMMQTLSGNDAKYRKAEAIICASPYSRKALVLSRYIFSLLIYPVILVIYIIMSLIVKKTVLFTFCDTMVALLIGNAILSITQPLVYKFGNEKTRFISIMMLLGVFCLAQAFTFIFPNKAINYSAIISLPSPIIGILALLLTIGILSLSAWASVSIYKKKEF